MTSPDERKLFALLDDYSKKHHRSFVAELFLNKTRTEYTVCFRPMDIESDSSNRYACQYLQLKTEEAELAVQTNEISASMREMLDKELINLDRPA
jgi:hypothetical protein